MPATPDQKKYAGGAVATTLASDIGAADTSIPLAASTGWPDGTDGRFWIVINKGGATEEKVYIASRSGNTLTALGRGGSNGDGTSGAAHATGESVQAAWVGADAQESNDHIRASTQVHGLASGVTVVGDTTVQTLTNKTLTNPTINADGGVVVLPGATTPAQTAEGSVVWDTDSDKLTVGTGAGRKTMVDTDSTQALTNKSLGGTAIIDLSTAGAALLLPRSASPAGTAEGDAVWDSDDDALTIGTGSARKTMVDTSGTQTLANKTLTLPTIADFTNAQHDHADAGGGGGVLFGASTAYTPVLQATLTNPTLGSTTPHVAAVGRYQRLGEMVFGWARIRWGSGGSAGAGTYFLSLPVSARVGLLTPTGHPVGSGYIWDASLGGAYPFTAQISTEENIFLFGPTGQATESTPASLGGSGDEIHVCFAYEAA